MRPPRLRPHIRVGCAGALGWILFDNPDIGTNFGYRWRQPNGSYWNTGAIAGVSCNPYREDFFFGMLEPSGGREF